MNSVCPSVCLYSYACKYSPIDINYILYMLLGFCSVSKMKCVKLLIPLQGHLNEFRYIMVCDKKSFTVYIKYITIFKTSRRIPDQLQTPVLGKNTIPKAIQHRRQ